MPFEFWLCAITEENRLWEPDADEFAATQEVDFFCSKEPNSDITYLEGN